MTHLLAVNMASKKGMRLLREGIHYLVVLLLFSYFNKDFVALVFHLSSFIAYIYFSVMGLKCLVSSADGRHNNWTLGSAF